MDIVEQLNKNKVFAKQFLPRIAPLFQGNEIAALRAAATATIDIQRDGGKCRFTMHMLTSRGTPTIPVGGSWKPTGEAVVTHSRNAIEFFLVAIGLDWQEFLTSYMPIGDGGREFHELKEVIEYLNPALVG